MKNKKTRLIVFVIMILIIAVTAFAVLNAGDIQEKQESQESASVTITQGDKIVKFDLEYLKTFKITEFNANLDESGDEPIEKSFGGVPLITVMEDKGIKLDAAKDVIFRAADGYTTVVTTKEAKDKENIFLVYERDGKPSGTKQQGGTGPIEIVICKDEFSQRWCKFLMDIEIK